MICKFRFPHLRLLKFKVFFVGFIVMSMMFAGFYSPITANFSDKFYDHKRDVATDRGDAPFTFSYIVRGRGHIDIISFEYEVNTGDKNIKVVFEFAEEPRLEKIFYTFRFESSTGNIDGPNFNISALDTIITIDFSYQLGERQEVSFYDADSGVDQIDINNITTSVSGNNVRFDFNYPTNFLIEEVFTQENLDITAFVSETENERTYYDIIYLNEDPALQVITQIMLYWWVLPVFALLIIAVIIFTILRNRSNKTLRQNKNS
jgi:hypothetical protein